MSVHASVKRITVPDLMAHKGKTPIVSLTAYHAHTARFVDPYVDFLLVGDSLGMVMYGMENTLGVTLDMMIAHGAAVVRGTERALVVVDMPFGSYEESPEIAFRNACRVIKETGCTAVKLEGGARMGPTIRYLTERGIPVMAHIGLTPQSTHVMGGFKTQGRLEEEWAAIEADARVVSEAGAFAVVLELVPAPLSKLITQKIGIPTIGIGAGPDCDGQVQVISDLLGLFSDFVPKHAKQYAKLAGEIKTALADYANEVRAGKFPTIKHSSTIDESLLEELESA